MLSFELGVLSLPLSFVTLGASIASFWLVTYVLTRRKNQQVTNFPQMLFMIIAGIAVARVWFVGAHWVEYQHDWLQIFNFSDGGFNIKLGWLTAAFVLLAITRGKNIRRTYYIAGFAAIMVYFTGQFAVSQYQMGMELPTQAAVTASGEPLSFHSFKGKPLVINFWATWCGPCQRELPVLEKAQQQYPSITFVFVNQYETVATVEDFLGQINVDLHHVLYDKRGLVSHDAGALGLPTTLFYDVSGQLVASHLGELSSESLEHYLQQLQNTPID